MSGISSRYYVRCVESASLSDEDLWDDVRAQCVSMALEGFRGLPAVTKRRVDALYDSVARSSVDATKARVRDVLLRSLVEAHSSPQPRRNKLIRQALDKVGVTDADGGVFKTLVRTHGSIGRNAAIWLRTYRDPAVWGYEYRTAEDERVRLSHARMDGKRYPKRHSFWRRFAPPNGWNCRCELVPIYIGTRQARTVPYRGVPDVDSEFMWNPGMTLAGLLAQGI